MTDLPNNINERFTANEERVASIEVVLDETRKELAENTVATKATRESVEEVLEILHAGKAFFRFVNHVGNLVKWVGAVAAPIVAIWYTVKSGNK